MRTRMHEDQVDVPLDVVADLVSEQLPQWRALPLRAVESHGTVNALFRLGDELVLRFPLQPGVEGLREELLLEQQHARLLAGAVPLEVPTPVAIGEPGAGYAGPWTVYRWIAGRTADHTGTRPDDDLARDLAGLVTALRRIPTDGRAWDERGRGGPLAEYDDAVRGALGESVHLVDTTRLARLWEACLAAPDHEGRGSWIHADLTPGNLVMRAGRLSAVIDLGAVGIGDPAVDLMPAWNLLEGRTRATFRRCLGDDDATWIRGSGWALLQAVMALPYYVDTNPVMAATAARTLTALAEEESDLFCPRPR